MQDASKFKLIDFYIHNNIIGILSTVESLNRCPNIISKYLVHHLYRLNFDQLQKIILSSENDLEIGIDLR